MLYIKRKIKKDFYGDILLSLLLIFLLGSCYVLTTHIFWKMTLDDCYSEIEGAAGDASTALRHFLESDRENLSLIAGALASESAGDTEMIKESLSTFSSHQYIDALCVQFADGTLIADGGRMPDYSALPSFSEAEENLPCISSGRFPGQEGENAEFLYQAVRVSFKGGTDAVLYGFTDLNSLPERFSTGLPYGGKSQLYIVDGDTGDFLMDTMHNFLGNLYDGSITSRTAMEGYDPEIMLEDVRSGREGYYVFFAGSEGEYYYTRYQPAGINNWSVELTVSEEVAFARVKEMNVIILIMGTVATAITLMYICVIFWKNWCRLKEKQEQIQQITFMFEVQQILFEAHQTQDLMVSALKRVAETVKAQGIFLMAAQNNRLSSKAAWYRTEDGFRIIEKEGDLKKDFPKVYQHLVKNQCVLYYRDRAAPFFSSEERELLDVLGIQSLMIASVMDTEGMRGVLCAANLEKYWDNCLYLECVAPSFMMALRNMESHQLAWDLAAIDTLTGMKNRNSYENDLSCYADTECQFLHCIYIDVNDLHGVNSQHGHEAGDRMLRCVADAVREAFGSEHTYRIGGDEFVIFSTEKADFIAGCLAKVRRLVESQGYHISAGVAGQRGDSIDMEKLVAGAESEMYREKKAYYERYGRRGISRRDEPESASEI